MVDFDGDGGRCFFGLCEINATCIYLTIVFNVIFLMSIICIIAISSIFNIYNISYDNSIGYGIFITLLTVLMIIFFSTLTYFTCKFNLKLMKPSHEHNIKHIKNWLIFHTFLYIMLAISMFYFGLYIYSSNWLILLSVGIIIIGVYQIRLVKRYYTQYLINQFSTWTENFELHTPTYC